MTITAVLTILQTLVIWTATIICYKSTRVDGGLEKKFILPYCYLNSLVMIPLTLIEFIGIPIKVTFIIMFTFACIEIVILPSYIASVIGRKKNIAVAIIISILALLISEILIKTTTSVIYLFCNIYITFYVYKYFIWLFSEKDRLVLKHTPHYWIIMGICICYTTSIPYFIAELFLIKLGGFEAYRKVGNIAFLTYILLNICMFILFIKSFKCKINLQRSLSGQL
jgi:hypothetical protein